MLYIKDAIMMVMMIFMIIGAIDKVCSNKRGYGAEFEKGIYATGPLILAAAAVMAISPAVAQVLSGVISPFFTAIHTDPSLFPAMLLCSDMGGYSIAMELAEYEAIGLYNGLVVAAIMGATFTFLMPLALVMLDKEDRKILVAGVLTGICCVPIGCFFGGLAMMFTPYPIGFWVVVKNLIPIGVVSLLIAFCLIRFPDGSVRVFGAVGAMISDSVILLTVAAIFQQITGIHIPFFEKMATPDSNTGFTGLDMGLLTCGRIGIVLAGAFPMVLWISRICRKPLEKLGNILEINSQSVTGFLAGSTNYAAGFGCFKGMDLKGKYLNTAFLVPGGCALGDLLGFTAGLNSDLLLPMLIGKLSGGIAALLLANILTPKMMKLFSDNGKEDKR